MTNQTLSERQDFVPIETSEVTNPRHLPFAYKWMQKGFYAIYKGELINNASKPTKADWGLEVNYVNDLSQHDEPSSLGYTLYMSSEGTSIGNWLNWPVLFVRYFDIRHPLGNEKVNIPSLGTISCFKALRGPENFAGVNKTMWYDEKTSLLVKMEAHTLNGARIYSCLLSEFSPSFSQARVGVSSSAQSPSVAAQRTLSEQDSSHPSKSVDVPGPRQEVEYEKARRNFVRAAHLATQNGFSEEEIRGLQRAALRQFIEEYHNFEGASVLVSEYKLSPAEVRNIVAEILANPTVAKATGVCFDKSGVVNKTLEDRIRQWLRLLR